MLLPLARERVANALKLLGVEYIDALILRLGMGPDINGTPIEDTAKAMKVRACNHLA